MIIQDQEKTIFENGKIAVMDEKQIQNILEDKSSKTLKKLQKLVSIFYVPI